MKTRSFNPALDDSLDCTLAGFAHFVKKRDKVSGNSSYTISEKQTCFKMSMSKQTQCSFLRDYVKYTSYTEGRDKIYRTIQYASRFVLWYLSRHGSQSSFQQKVKNLESAITTSRKLFRMARCIDFALKAVDALRTTDEKLMIFSLIGSIGKAGWLVLDHAIWFGQIKVFTVESQRWAKISYWLWLIGVTALALRDLRKISLLTAQAKRLKSDGEKGEKIALKAEIEKARLEFLIDFSDAFIPLSALDFCSKGIGALGGVVASVAGGYIAYEKNVLANR
ncbi:peroxisomal membrane protein 11A-like [Anneissia japonica]|uniref:peroxisomal membrane protein 11A-like n=1 Tax=Anneissia japonica TaxID=1529436 RepID=UPI0014258A1D|nr:peroxisomal membrane protein 11A-like [Anneissia japonica]